MTAAEHTVDVTSETAPEPKEPGTSRVGLIVPSSNTTMETELPELFRRQSELRATGTRFTRRGPA